VITNEDSESTKAVQMGIRLSRFEGGKEVYEKGEDEPQLTVGGRMSTDLFEHNFDDFLSFEGLQRGFD
jgi:hypothetical protein